MNASVHPSPNDFVWGGRSAEKTVADENEPGLKAHCSCSGKASVE